MSLLGGSVLPLVPARAWAVAEGPRPPCAGAAPLPAYAEPGAPPAVRVWNGAELDAAGWTPPACTGWPPAPAPRTLAALAGRFRRAGGVEALLARFAAVSALTTVRYWSVADGRWARLFDDASALRGPDAALRRPDFATAELTPGAELFLALDDSRSTGMVVHRLRVLEASPGRLAVSLENVGAVRYLLLPLAGPGDLRSAFFLDRGRGALEAWSCYALTAIGAGASGLLAGHASSVVNRAAALYRHLAGVPTDQEPPAAP